MVVFQTWLLATIRTPTPKMVMAGTSLMALPSLPWPLPKQAKSSAPVGRGPKCECCRG